MQKTHEKAAGVGSTLRGRIKTAGSGVSMQSSQNGVRAMKAFFFMSAVLVGIAGNSTHADAQNYPWCAYYSGGRGGGTNCGFTTFEQCMATVSGIGGYCTLNTQYVPPPGPHRRY
jgi:hypothetical protein